jgi:heme/copper-type cytochrome/quinol oxidase subunit 3
VVRTLGTPRARDAAPNGVWGMALFLAAEVTLFGTLFGSYFYLKTVNRAWPPDHIKPPEVLDPTLTTVLLLATLVPIHLAARASRAGSRNRTIVAVVAALFAQLGYLACQVLLFAHDLHQFSPQGSAYGSIYFTLLSVHHAHVALGVALDLVLIWKLTSRGLTRYWLIAVRNLALYWYVVGALAVLVLLTQISPSL